MTRPASSLKPRPRARSGVIGRLMAGLVRQLELPFFDGGVASSSGTDARGRVRGQSTITPKAPVDPGSRSIVLGGRALEYTFRRARRKTIGLSITANGLTVAAPRWVGIGQVEAAIRERELWVFTKLADMQRHRASIPQVRWADGGTLPYLGAPITMRVAAAQSRIARTSFDRDARTLTLSLPPGATAAQIRDRAEAWMQNEARSLFRERLALYEQRLGIAHRVLRLSSARTRWGSCSADGRILLNWRLIHFPLSSIDYVVAHELAHLKEMNHGPKFWATVAALLPDYEAAKEQVRDPPPELMPTL